MGTIYKKEVRSYFNNMSAYISAALILLVAGFLAKTLSFDGKYPEFEYILPTVALILIIAVPIVAMRSFAEEKTLKTDLLLYSLPLTMTQIVMGKFFAMLTVFALPIGIMCIFPIVISMYGTVNLLGAFAALIAFFLLCAAMTAICMFMSSLTESQVIAAVLGITALGLCYIAPNLSSMIPTSPIASFVSFSVLIALLTLAVYYFTKSVYFSCTVFAVLEAALLGLYLSDSTFFTGLFGAFISRLSIFNVLTGFIGTRLVDLTVFVYYISIAFIFCLLTVQTADRRRLN